MDGLDTNVDMIIEDLAMEEADIEQDEFLNSKNVEKEFDNDLLNYALIIKIERLVSMLTRLLKLAVFLLSNNSTLILCCQICRNL
jgi:hypothetical protein